MIESLLDTAPRPHGRRPATRASATASAVAAGSAELPRMEGKTVLVTGATSGLGLAAAHALARLGASVRLLARSAERAELARAEIVERVGQRATSASTSAT